MAPVLSPSQVAIDMLCCVGLGFFVGAARTIVVVRSQLLQFIADFLATLLGLILVQSYAAQSANAGSLRFYMVIGLVIGVASFQWAIAPFFMRFVHMLRFVISYPLHIVVFCVIRPAKQGVKAVFACCVAKKRQKEVEKTTKKRLQKHREMLYNSNM